MFSRTSAPAPITDPLPIRTPLSKMAPMPIRQSSCTTQPCRIDPMADGDPVAHDARHAGVGVNHRQVLDIRLFADRDSVGIAAQHRVVPDTRALSE